MKSKEMEPSLANWILVMGFDINFSPSALALNKVEAGTVSFVKFWLMMSVVSSLK